MFAVDFPDSVKEGCAKCQVPTKAVLSLSSSAGYGREITVKALWVGVSSGRDHSAVPS